MGFACPICSERLERLPAEAQASGRAGATEVNISATPCGHIFHAYCIQKWLHGTLASSKQCPCCRKEVPRLRCLSLYPTTYEDDSVLEDSQGQGAVPCNHGEIITNLKGKVDRLEAEFKEKDQLYQLLSNDFETIMDKLRTEKITSDMWMMKAKQFESFKDIAEEKSARLLLVESQLKKYNLLDSMLKTVDSKVSENIRDYPPTVETVRMLLEMKQILMTERRTGSIKYEEMKSSYEKARTDKMKLMAKCAKLEEELKEVNHVFKSSQSRGKALFERDGSLSPIAGSSGKQSETPKAFKISKQRLQESLSNSAVNRKSFGLDEDVDVIPLESKRSRLEKKKPHTSIQSHLKRSLPHVELEEVDLVSSDSASTCSLSQGYNPRNPKFKKVKSSPALSDTITISDDDSQSQQVLDIDDDDFVQRSVPGAPLPISSKRAKTLLQKAEKPALGLASKSKFKFTKKDRSQ